ncbi:MAG: hypothetical protein ACJA0E_001296 [Bermanella sp.]|jgi:hypothetical protein
MQSIKQFQNNQNRIFASVVSEPKQGLLMDIWNDQAQSVEDLELVVNYSLKSIDDYQLSSWLSDISKLEAFFDFNGEAAARYLKRKLKHSSLRKFAFIHRSNRHLHSHSLNRLVTIFLDAGIEVKMCASSVMAMRWLLMPTLTKKGKPKLEM